MDLAPGAERAAAATGEREITASRIFDAPRDLVFRVWTEPGHVAKWWGPDGFRTTIETMDVRPGGDRRFVMHGPDGTDYPNRIVYLEVLPPERLVYDHLSGPRFRMTVLFSEEGKKTRVTVRMLFPSAADRDRTVETFHAVDGLGQTLGRLGEHVREVAR
ncbi:MAG TPA: SRPBCC family protein [Thermoanaerobaculia bacterium]|nr:SRPBCC family protein [Thermoanaerobaculia bacterium]